MAEKGRKYLGIKDIIIPSQKLEKSETLLEFGFCPSRILDLGDATNTIEGRTHGCHVQMPRLLRADKENVRFVGISVKGYKGYGSSCPTISRADYDELKRRCLAASDREMIGQPVTVVYRNNFFVGFIAPYTNVREVKESGQRQIKK